MSFELIPPTVSFEGVTDQERRIAEKYTRIRETCVDGLPDAHTSWVYIEGQHFSFGADYWDTKEQAEWSCWMMTRALCRLMAIEREPATAYCLAHADSRTNAASHGHMLEVLRLLGHERKTK